MENRQGVALGVALTILALMIGVFGIAVLIGVGEGANNGVVAFAAVSLPLAVLAGFFSWISPHFRWAIAIAISAPVALISCASSWSGGYLMLGAIWTVALSMAGAYLGARMRLSGSRMKQPPLS